MTDVALTRKITHKSCDDFLFASFSIHSYFVRSCESRKSSVLMMKVAVSQFSLARRNLKDDIQCFL
jgi:hypothetical protein